MLPCLADRFLNPAPIFANVPAALTGRCSEAGPCFWKTKAALMRLAVSRLVSLPLKEGLKCLNPLLLSAYRHRTTRKSFGKGTLRVTKQVC